MNPRLLRLTVFGFGGLIIILGLLTIFTQKREQSTTLQSVSKLPAIFSVSAAGPDDTLITSNGRSFVSYNFKTAQTTLLSPDDSTSGLDGVDALLTSDDGTYIVFHQTLAGFGTTLKNTLENAGLNSDKAYWWLYNTKTQAYTPLKQSISNTNASVSGDTVSIIDADPDSSDPKITSFNFSNPTSPSDSIAVTSSDGFVRVKDGYVLTRFNEGNGHSILFTKDGVVSTQLLTDARVSAYASSVDTLFVSTANAEGSTLVAYEMESGEQTEIAADVGSTVAQHGKTLIFTKGGILMSYDVTTKKVQKLTISNKTYATTIFTPVLALGASTVVVQHNDSTYIAGNDLKAPKSPTSYSESVIVGNNAIDITYDEDESAFLVTLDASSADAEKNAVYQKLRDDGFNPDLLDIRFTVFTPPTVTL